MARFCVRKLLPVKLGSNFKDPIGNRAVTMSFWNKLLMRGNANVLSFILAVLCVSSVLFLYYSQNSFLEAFEAKTYDLRFKDLRGPIQPNPDIAIIAIDDKSIAELGRYPWSRDRYAHLIDRLAAAKAKVIVFDAFFPERENVKNDRLFAAAIKRAGNVVLAAAFHFGKEDRVTSITRSLPEIEKGTAGIGLINQIPDDDGVVRRIPLLLEKDGKQMPSLGLVGAMLALGETNFTLKDFDIELGDRRIPVDGDYKMSKSFSVKFVFPACCSSTTHRILSLRPLRPRPTIFGSKTCADRFSPILILPSSPLTTRVLPSWGDIHGAVIVMRT